MLLRVYFLMFLVSQYIRINGYRCGTNWANKQVSFATVRKLMRPDDIIIPLDKVDFSYARSSGPGGQNVNKVNTKAEVRFHVNTADWLPVDVRNRLLSYQENKVTKEGMLVVTSQEHRTQAKNREDCMSKLRVMIAEAYIEPKDRQMWEGISEEGKRQRVKDKKQRGAVKNVRRSKNFDFDD